MGPPTPGTGQPAGGLCRRLAARERVSLPVDGSFGALFHLSSKTRRAVPQNGNGGLQKPATAKAQSQPPALHDSVSVCGPGHVTVPTELLSPGPTAGTPTAPTAGLLPHGLWGLRSARPWPRHGCPTTSKPSQCVTARTEFTFLEIRFVRNWCVI